MTSEMKLEETCPVLRQGSMCLGLASDPYVWKPSPGGEIKNKFGCCVKPGLPVFSGIIFFTPEFKCSDVGKII